MSINASNPRSAAQSVHDRDVVFLRTLTPPPRALTPGPHAASTLLRREWLLTDGLGGFAMGTAIGAATRKYHSLYTAATRSPLGRVNALANVADTLILRGDDGEDRIDLCAFRFGDLLLHPTGADRLARFETLDPEDAGAVGARWTYAGPDWRVTRTLRPLWRVGGVRIEYTVETDRPATLEIRPLVALRDMHALRREDGGFVARAAPAPAGAAACTVERDGLSLTLAADHAEMRLEPDWWRGFRYDRDADRHYPDTEDLFCPGRFVSAITTTRGSAASVTFAARLTTPAEALLRLASARDARAPHLLSAARRLTPGAPPTAAARLLAQSADDFVVARSVDGRDGATIIAGYPWFADWGRDTMIALPGLLLATGRRADALAVLRIFTAHLRNGLLPNCFDDRSGEPQYNSADAAFWFLRAAAAVIEAAPDEPPPAFLLEACATVIRAISEGTDYGIGIDPADGLVFAGDATTQLTWMDAKADGQPCTPRYGKPVELSALWADALRRLAPRLPAPLAAECRGMSDRAQASLREKFWRPALGCLCDCLRPDVPGVGVTAAGAWTPVDEIRPNMLIAAALEHTGLTAEQRRGVVRVARERLLTPVGVRTLAPGSPAYRPRYEGPMPERDRAYHNGTVWPWLLGFYIEAALRAEAFSAGARAEAHATLQDAVRRLFDDCCVGSVAEVYDADAPHRPDGCPAQAWSVAELLRAATLV